MKCFKKSYLRFLAVSMFLVSAMAFITGCGGGGGGVSSYDNPDVDYYAGEESASALVQADELYSWIKNGYKTENGDPVIIIDIQNNPGDEEIWFAGDVAKISKVVGPGGMTAAMALDKAGYIGHLPGSFYSVSHEGYIVPNRNDGPIDTDHQIGNGNLVTQWLQKYGITKNTVIVLTQGNLTYPGFCPARVFWTLRYWGMSKKYLKVLDGSIVAWADYIKANHPDEVFSMGLQRGLTVPKATPSTIDVADFPKRNLNLRTTIGELISYIDSGKTTDGSVAVLDTRQPPTPFYFNDITEYAPVNYALKQKAGDNLPEWSDTAFMPMDFNGQNSNGGDLSAYAGKIKAFAKNGFPYPVNISAKAAAFDGEVKGSIQIKGKNASGVPFNIAGPAAAWMNPVMYDGKPAFAVFKKYKQPSEVAFPTADWNADGKADGVSVGDMFARVFPDKNQPIVTYCNSGAMAAFYWFHMTEVLGYTNVSIYDGSWIEWGSSIAFEPNRNNKTEAMKVVSSEIYSWFPKYGATTLNSPKLLMFGSGDFTMFHIEVENGKYYAVDDDISATKFEKCEVGLAGCPVAFGGNLSGNTTWDTLSRSERVSFRASSLVNSGVKGSSDNVSSIKEYNSVTNWPIVTTYPGYIGEGIETKVEDEGYNGFTGGGSSGGAPEAFVPKGGGC